MLKSGRVPAPSRTKLRCEPRRWAVLSQAWTLPTVADQTVSALSPSVATRTATPTGLGPAAGGLHDLVDS
eukprot:8260205-Alexandrium_andersonii.AAC.1